METKLHPRLQKNIYDLSHERYLQKSHTWANLGTASVFAFLGGIATYLIEGGGEITNGLVIFILLILSSIFAVFYFLYRKTREKRFEVISNIKKLNSEAEKL